MSKKPDVTVSPEEMLAAVQKSPREMFEQKKGGLEFRVKSYIKLMKSKNENVRLNALTTVSKMCSDFPAEKQSHSITGPITIAWEQEQ